MDTFGGALMLDKAMNSKGFGAFWHLKGVHFWILSWTPGFLVICRDLIQNPRLKYGNPIIFQLIPGNQTDPSIFWKMGKLIIKMYVLSSIQMLIKFQAGEFRNE